MVTKKDKYLAAAQKHLERGSLEKALTDLQNAVKEDPKDTRTWLRMAEVHVRLGQNDKATEVYQKTVDLYVEQGFFQRAVAVYKNIIKLSPEFVDARVKLADVYKQLGLLSDAVQQLEQAATLHQKAGRVADALGALKQIIELNPEQAAGHMRYAELASQAGQVDRAITEFTEAAKLLKQQGRNEEYLRVAERLLLHEPGNTALAMEVAAQRLDRNDARGAMTWLKQCFEADRTNPDVLELLARAFEQLGQPHKTLPVLKELSRLYSEAGRTAERNQAIQRVLALDPNDPEALEMLARGQPTGARAYSPLNVTPMRVGASPGPSIVVSPVPPAEPLKRPGSITFSEMEVPEALKAKYKTPPPEVNPLPLDPVAIASGLIERPEDTGEIKRILAETDIFVKYGLLERAADHLRRVFDLVPTHVGVHERLAALLVQLGRKTEAAAELEVLAQQTLPNDPVEAAGYARRALELNPGASRARAIVAAAETQGAGVSREQDAEDTAAVLAEMGTPEPELLSSDDIEIVGEGFTQAGTTDGGDTAALADAFGEADEGAGEATRFEASPLAAAAAEADDRTVPRAISSGTELDPALLGDLEQVDFFIDQALFDEAATLLGDIESAHPRSELVAARRARLAAASANQGKTRATAAVAELAVPARTKGGPAGQDELDVHADLGLMNKTIERHAEAIQHFNALLADPAREVYALTMIGESYEALGNPADAIRSYQEALKRPQATEAEATQLYYQLGNVFLNMGDRTEALYYFERVSKREPSFRDVQQRLVDLRHRSAAR